jgi:8-oxo-dGTP diphosphatase
MTEKPKVGVGVLIVDDDKILLGKRIGALGNGTWALPGGLMEKFETFEDCAKREVKEETGLDIEGLEVISLSNDVMYGDHTITIGLKANKFVGKPEVKEPSKCEKWEWFDIDDLPEPLFIASKSVIDNYLAKKFYR